MRVTRAAGLTVTARYIPGWFTDTGPRYRSWRCRSCDLSVWCRGWRVSGGFPWCCPDALVSELGIGLAAGVATVMREEIRGVGTVTGRYTRRWCTDTTVRERTEKNA